LSVRFGGDTNKVNGQSNTSSKTKFHI
jgi:hypothetical protein